MPKCVVPECNSVSGYCPEKKRRVGGRGLCMTCYRSAWQRIKKGILTWQTLEDIGLALPSEAAPPSLITLEIKRRIKANLSEGNVIIPKHTLMKVIEYAEENHPSENRPRWLQTLKEVVELQ